MKWIASFLGGSFLGFASVALHNSYPPFGLAISLLGTWLGVSIVGKVFMARGYKLATSAGWLLVVIRAAAPGVGGELLIEGNSTGNLLISLGIAALILGIFSST
jgi:hypothetical protein